MTFLREMIPHIQSEVITYGIDTEADYIASDIHVRRSQGYVYCAVQGAALGQISLSVPGKHNVYNALATLITCLEAGLIFRENCRSDSEFRGAKRRFQVLGEVDESWSLMTTRIILRKFKLRFLQQKQQENAS